MSGASLKWYLRHQQDGRFLEEDEKLARNRVRDNASFVSGGRKNGNTASASKRSSGIRSRRPVNATPTVRRGSEKASPPTTQTKKPKSGKITPQGPPNSKRKRKNHEQGTEGQQSASNPPSSGDTVQICGCFKRHTDGCALQDLVIEEIYRGCGYPVSFHGVYFKRGMLHVDCKDESTANCLREIGSKLEGWQRGGRQW